MFYDKDGTIVKVSLKVRKTKYNKSLIYESIFAPIVSLIISQNRPETKLFCTFFCRRDYK